MDKLTLLNFALSLKHILGKIMSHIAREARQLFLHLYLRQLDVSLAIRGREIVYQIDGRVLYNSLTNPLLLYNLDLTDLP